MKQSKKNMIILLITFLFILFVILMFLLYKQNFLLNHKDKNIGKNDISITELGRNSEYDPENSNMFKVEEIENLEKLEKLKEENKNFILVVGSKGCKYCVKLEPEISKLAEKGFLIRKINVLNLNLKEFISSLNIRSYPTIILYKDLKEIGRQEEYLEYEKLKDWIEKTYITD